MNSIQIPGNQRVEVLQAGASLLAIDHGTRSGWAAWNRANGRLYLHGTIEGNPRQAASLINRLQPAAVIIEDWHIPRKGFSAKTIKVIAKNFHTWATVAAIHRRVEGIAVMSPASWKAWANKHLAGDLIPAGRKTDAKQINAAIIGKAKEYAASHGIPADAVRRIEADEADAILIGAAFLADVKKFSNMELAAANFSQSTGALH